MSEGTTCEDLLRNFMRGRQWALDKCELSILFCQHLAWYPKTALPLLQALNPVTFCHLPSTHLPGWASGPQIPTCLHSA